MTIQIKHPTLEKLWQFAEFKLPHKPNEDSTTFCDVGLWLISPSKDGHYSCTPTNSVTFAQTGGDGVHFGLVEIDGLIVETSPVVMTVPMMDDTNLIVGENLSDFLALGCKFGYCELEQLVYDEAETLKALSIMRFPDDMELEERDLLEKISQAFGGLQPWTEPKTHFNYLQKKYSTLLQFSTPIEDIEPSNERDDLLAALLSRAKNRNGNQ